MRNKIFFYMVINILSCIFTAQAIDADSVEQKRQAALAELHEIVDSIPRPIYDEKDMLLAPSPLPQKTENAGFFENAPPTVILQILQYLSLRGIYNVGQTCKYFQAFLGAPGLTLNSYCCQPGIAQAMPLPLLIKKTLNTPNGILMLAAGISVNPSELRGWFLPEDFERALQHCPPLPATPEGLSDEELVSLIPQIKITVALLSPQDQSERGVALRNFFSQHQRPRSIGGSYVYFNIIQYLSNYFQGFEVRGMLPIHFYTLCERRDQVDYSPERHVAADLMAWTLLKNPKFIPGVLCSGYLRAKPYLRPMGLKLLQWCWNNRDIQDFDLLNMGAPTQGLGIQLADAAMTICESLPQAKIPSVVPEILKSIIFNPNGNDPHGWTLKIRAIMLCGNSPWIQEESEQFSRFLLALWQRDQNRWNFNIPANYTPIDYYPKEIYVRFLMGAGVRDCIPDMYRDLLENSNIMGHPTDCLLNHLVSHQFLELAEDLIKRKLTDEATVFLPRTFDIEGFTRHLVNLNAQCFVPIMKAKFDREYQHWSLSNKLENQAQFLIGLLTSMNPEEYREYASQTADTICSQAKSTEMKTSTYQAIARLFYHLGNKGLMKKYFQQWLESVEKNPILKNTILQALIDKGVKLFSWVDVKELEYSVIEEFLKPTDLMY